MTAATLAATITTNASAPRSASAATKPRAQAGSAPPSGVVAASWLEPATVAADKADVTTLIQTETVVVLPEASGI